MRTPVAMGVPKCWLMLVPAKFKLCLLRFWTMVISTEIVAPVSKKALLLKILLNGDTGDHCPPSVGQVGFIRGDQIAPSPNNLRSTQRRAVAGRNDTPVPLPVDVGQSRFSVTPITSCHNVASQTIGGHSFECDESAILPPAGASRVIKDFHRARESIPS